MVKTFLASLVEAFDALPSKCKHPENAAAVRQIWDNIKTGLEMDANFKDAKPEAQYDQVIRLLTDAHRVWAGKLKEALINNKRPEDSSLRRQAIETAETEHYATRQLMRWTLITWNNFNGD